MIHGNLVIAMTAMGITQLSALTKMEDNYLCAACFGVFDSIQCCDWCNQLNTGDMEHSYLAGCNFCDGKFGWDAND